MGRLFRLLQRYRYLALFILLGAVALIMILPRKKKENETPFLPKAVLELFGPFQKGLTKGTDFFGGILDRYLFLFHVKEENRLLREIVEELKQERVQLLEAKSENERLRALLAFKEKVPKLLLPAQVIGRDLSGWFQTLTIDRGKEDGIDEGMAVLSVQGIVGQIMESSENFSRVLLVTDPNSAVAALIQRTRARGIVEGTGPNRCRLKYLHRSEDVIEGDQVLSSGLDGIYPKGTLIGTVTGVTKKESDLFQHVTLRLSVDIHKLEEVVVLCEKPAGRQPQDGENRH